jgi:hypothetical protein
VPCHTPEETVPKADTFPEAFRFTDFPDGYVSNTETVPENVTALPEFEEDRIVVRVSVGPVVE